MSSRRWTPTATGSASARYTNERESANEALLRRQSNELMKDAESHHGPQYRLVAQSTRSGASGGTGSRWQAASPVL